MPLTEFSLIRHGDGLEYCFSAQGAHNGRLAYKRSDADLWILWHPRWGWYAPAADGSVAGLSFSLPPKEQANRPPQGPWVSRKAGASYVYDLRWGGESRQERTVASEGASA
ncbi:hypothetical protein [Flavimaricola marinus]|uniref:Uncharacterized protein n=1 Tax=Flavimaricola marinus TaxID=1819565 RepID=A0A238LFS2_9RHOB|nr:hypothetical protein [Flavimaricola marinus]SMY08567.1 hypothetical protein LOM8899_02720 [Flavimaricola marinus]